MAIQFGCTRIVMLSILIFFFFFFFFSFPQLALSLTFNKIQLPPGVTGPESLAFDPLGAGFYVSVHDGRILKYQGPNAGFQDFAFTSPNRSIAMCNGRTDEDLEPICGRALGLGFNYLTNDLYIADAYVGLLVVGPNGRLATLLATSAEGVPFRFLNGLGVDPITGDVYFTEFSSVYQLRNITKAVQNGDATGRLLKYDLKTKQVIVLLRGLSGPAGTSVSADGRFVLVSELIGRRIQRYWLRGPKNNTAEIFVAFQGRPDNIKRTIVGNFWVAVNILKPFSTDTVPTRILITPYGTILETILLDKEYNTTMISEVQETIGGYYIGSPLTNYIGVYTI